MLLFVAVCWCWLFVFSNNYKVKITHVRSLVQNCLAAAVQHLSQKCLQWEHQRCLQCTVVLLGDIYTHFILL